MKFKDKIHYILKKDIPFDIEEISDSDNENEHYRKSIFNASKRENLQRNQILDGLKDLEPNDWVIISDLDEIPNLENVDFYNIKNKFLFFQQSMMYYKFNLKLDNFTWTGSRACKFKHLKSPQWLRNIKTKKYNFYRFDTLFSKTKYTDVKIINDGGWHFSQLKKIDDIYSKLTNSEDHQEFKDTGKKISDIEDLVNRKVILYDHKAKSSDFKFGKEFKLETIGLEEMPDYIKKNKDQFREWIDTTY